MDNESKATRAKLVRDLADRRSDRVHHADCSNSPLGRKRSSKLYGGTERVVAWLVDELVRLGHDVTLFASGDSDKRGAGTLLTRPVLARVRKNQAKGVGELAVDFSLSISD